MRPVGSAEKRHLAAPTSARDHRVVDDAPDREDVNAILSGIFDVNVKLSRIDENLERIRKWLEEEDDGEEEDRSSGPSA